MTMIKDIIQNSSMNAKMHSKMRGILKDKEYERLIVMKSVPQVAEYLKNNTRFGEILGDVDVETIHRGQLEARLHTLITQDLQSFLAFSETSSKFFLNLFEVKNEIAYIKVLMRLLKSGEREGEDSVYRHGTELKSNIDFTELANIKSMDAFLEKLEATIFGRPLRHFKENPERQNMFEIEMALDNFYRDLVFSYTKKYLSKTEAKIAEKTFGTATDLENIMYIVRAKKYYGFSTEMIFTHLYMHSTGLKKEEIRAIAEANGDAEMLDAIMATRYGKVFAGTLENAENRINMYILKIHRRMFRQKPYSIEAILYYVKMREIEIKNIIMIIEGIRYGLKPQTIKGYLIGTCSD